MIAARGRPPSVRCFAPRKTSGTFVMIPMFFRRIVAALPILAFILLWSSGAIVSEVALRHSSPFALHIVRSLVALCVLVLIAAWNGRILPEPKTRPRIALTGLLAGGVYSCCFLLALDNGVTPGALVTMLGIQPIATLFLTEKRPTSMRLIGLGSALTGLVLVAFDGLRSTHFSALGLTFAALALMGITAGSILQKRETQPPSVVLPLQFAVGLMFAGLVAPFVPIHVEWHRDLILAVLWLGILISVTATFLLYRLIAKGNLVNVTSLFYMVPVATAAMDWLFLSHPMSVAAIVGLVLILAGLLTVFHHTEA
jgi:drug/metabolite transporter (DMT)-like permease